MECHRTTLWKANTETGFETEQLKTVVALYEQDIVHKDMSNQRLKTMVKKSLDQKVPARTSSQKRKNRDKVSSSSMSALLASLSRTSRRLSWPRGREFLPGGTFSPYRTQTSWDFKTSLCSFSFVVCCFRFNLQQLLHPSGIPGDWFHDSFFSFIKHPAKWNFFGQILPAFEVQIPAFSFFLSTAGALVL